MATSYSPDSNAKISSQAIWSLVLGILSITCLWILGSIPAIILGILAIKNIDRSAGRLTGKGLAIGGIATGGAGVFIGMVTFGFVAAVTLPVVVKVKEKADLAKQLSEMRQITLGCLSYASDNDDKFPKDLAVLVSDFYLDSEEMLMWSPADDPSVAPMPYRYRSQLDHVADFSEPFLAAPASIAGKIAVAYPDGRVEAMDEEEFNAKFAASFP